MDRKWIFAPLVTVLCTGIAGDAMARNVYPTRVPNGNVHQCLTCHTVSTGGPGNLNPMGMDVRRTLTDDDLPNWSRLYRIDSDGDGQTNGEELGDPCGDWRFGRRPPRRTDISRPGVAASTSADPFTPSCPGVMRPDAGTVDAGPAMAPADAGVVPPPAASPDDGGCSTSGARGDVGMFFLLLVAWATTRHRGWGH